MDFDEIPSVCSIVNFSTELWPLFDLKFQFLEIMIGF